MVRRALIATATIAAFVLYCVIIFASSRWGLTLRRPSHLLIKHNFAVRRQANSTDVLTHDTGTGEAKAAAEGVAASFSCNAADCPHLRARAAATAAADAIASRPVSPRTIIINATLISVDGDFIDGWVIRGSSIVASALFDGDPQTKRIMLYDAAGSGVSCSTTERIGPG
jgi:hypothetical protein